MVETVRVQPSVTNRTVLLMVVIVSHHWSCGECGWYSRYICEKNYLWVYIWDKNNETLKNTQDKLENNKCTEMKVVQYW